MKTALITGITGQDGAYLAKFLLDKNYTIYGTYRRISSPNFWRLQYLGIYDRVKLIPVDLTDQGSLNEAVRLASPGELYHLAAQSFVESSFQTPYSTGEITGLSTVSVLEALRQLQLDTKFYFASTSELYGFSGVHLKGKLNENSMFRPMSPYAVAKLYSHWITKIYREGYSIFATNGILFNHESPIRGLEFVTRKIANSVAKIKLGLSNQIKLGNLDAKRDWGYAPDYVKAMWMMLQHTEPDDFVVATGEMHTVKEFLELASDTASISYQDYLVHDKSLLRPLDVPSLIGDNSKISEEIGWRPSVDFKQLVQIMVKEEIKRWELAMEGEQFPWDANNYLCGNEKILRRGNNESRKRS